MMYTPESSQNVPLISLLLTLPGKMHGLHPRELTECAFDIITPNCHLRYMVYTPESSQSVPLISSLLTLPGKIHGLHPRELTECAFDIITPNSAR